MKSRTSLCLVALSVMVLGVPAVACGGKVLVEGGGDGGPTGTSATTSPSGGAGTSTGSNGTPTATGSVAPTGSTSSPPSSSFGNYPCTAYTAWYYSCPPIEGTGGCKFAVPQDGNPVDGWIDSTTQSQGGGCQLEIVAPTDVGGSTCQVLALCECDAASTWVTESAGPAHPPSCPND